MKKFKYGIVTLAIILCSILIISFFGALFANMAEPEIMEEHTVNTELGTEMLALSIKDVSGSKKVTSFNIVKGEFVSNTQPKDVVYSHDINDLGNRGTIQIFIDNLNPELENFSSEAALLEHLKVESSYKFSVHIPQIFAASVVYANAQFLSATGEIENYDFVEFMNQPEVTSTHISKTEPLTLNVSMNAERRYMSPSSPLRNGTLITLHYEAPEGKTAVIGGDILIGERGDVDKVTERNSMSLYLVQTLSIAVLAILIFVAVLKKRSDFLPQIMYIFGISGLYTTAVLCESACEFPYLIIALGGLSASIVALGIALSVKKKIAFLPVRIILCILSGVLCVFSFILPFVSGGAWNAIVVIIKVLQCLILISSVLLLAYETVAVNKIKMKISGFAALVFLALCIFGRTELQFFSPIFSISIVLLIITACISLHEFVLIEKRNRYLTDNLEAEIQRQTESLTHIIGERDDLLRYISHDLRRSIVGVQKILSDTVSDDKLVAKTAASAVRSKLDTVENALGEISKFSKNNYQAEQSVIFRLDEVLEKVQNDLASDCGANGVHFKIKTSGIEVFAKPNALYSILSNLIFNALEHSDCDAIEISAEKYGKKQCRLKVSDNGKGANNNLNLFTPYNTSYDVEGNTGLGLYISRQFAISMGGDLLYQREGNITTFSVILPIV